MSVGYTTVQWNAHKKYYDILFAIGIIVYIALFIAVSSITQAENEQFSEMSLLIRAFGSCAILLLHFILIIGPMARLSTSWAPVLYNRRHLGVMTAIVALLHGVLVTLFYHGFGSINPFLSLLTSSSEYTHFTSFPFEVFGLLALLLLILLASISHDFWQKNLGRDTWKSIHMLVYLVYALVVLHVALGILQSEDSYVYAGLMAFGVLTVSGLHIAVSLKERKVDLGQSFENEWLEVAPVDDFVMNRAKTVCAEGGERIAVFKHENGFSAVTNLCAHQGGPLGEGQIIDGCITCPWHGWQYRPEDGQSPPPFEEKVETYQVKVREGQVYVSTRAQAPGTKLEPAKGELT